MLEIKRLKESIVITDKGYSDLKLSLLSYIIENFSFVLTYLIIVRAISILLEGMKKGSIDIEQLWVTCGIGVIASFVILIAVKYQYKKSDQPSYEESERLRLNVAEHLRKLPMSFFNNSNLSMLTQNMMADCAMSEGMLSGMVPAAYANVITIAVIFVILLTIDWRLTLAVFATVPASFIIEILSMKYQQRLIDEQLEAKEEAGNQIQEYIEGMKVIKSNCIGGEKFNYLTESLLKLHKMSFKTEMTSGILVAGADAVLEIGVGLTVLSASMYLSDESIDLITMILFSMTVLLIYGPITKQLSRVVEFTYFKSSVRRLKNLMEIKISDENENTEITEFNICFDNVSFDYYSDSINKSSNKVLDNLSFTIPADKVTAIVGASGCGKSTITKLIGKFWGVDYGTIRIGGIDISTLKSEHLLEYISFVFQDVILFNDTIFNNIKVGNMNATKEQVMAAAKSACCDEFVMKMPNNYNTVLAENGNSLSGGERQRISIARALLKNSPIVILDEATSSLDPENESLVQEAITKLIQNKTVIVISHRLRTIVNADQIIVIEKGRVEEIGSHKELMKRNGLYKRMYEIQQLSMNWKL